MDSSINQILTGKYQPDSGSRSTSMRLFYISVLKSLKSRTLEEETGRGKELQLYLRTILLWSLAFGVFLAVPHAYEKKDEEKEDPKGIPEFWLTVFKNVDLLSDMVQEHDEPILKHLKDIKVKFSDAGQPMSFVLEFHFEPNEYFTNEVLTKTYRMRSEPQGSDDSDPFSFDGPEIMGCTGCQIDWKKGKNVTRMSLKKQQKHKGRGTVRTVTKTVSNDSFFNFFAPPEVPESGDLDDDSEAILAADFEIGHFLRERIIPRSVLYFTGEAIEDDDDDYDEEGEEADEEGEEEGDEENDPDYDPKKDQNPAECKQQ
nr:PREDICTED: nucleosome assembly protein 1-like 1 [Bos mutus]